MQKLFTTLVILSLSFQGITAQDFNDTKLGIKLQLSENWRQVPVLESNKPHSIFEAIRKENTKEFLTLVVYPSTELPVNETALETWAAGLATMFGEKQPVKKVELQKINGVDWYSAQTKFGNKGAIFFYCTIQNGFSYHFSFADADILDKQFAQEAAQMVTSVQFSTPTILEELIKDFDNAKLDSTTNLYIPAFSTMTQNLQNLPPNAIGLYQELLAQKNADYVWVTADYFKQLVLMNVKSGMKNADNRSLELITKMVGAKFRQDGAIYEELFVGDWQELPEKVFMSKFRLTRGSKKTTHYIFYIRSESGISMIKYQLSAILEEKLEPKIYALAKKQAR